MKKKKPGARTATAGPGLWLSLLKEDSKLKKGRLKVDSNLRRLEAQKGRMVRPPGQPQMRLSLSRNAHRLTMEPGLNPRRLKAQKSRLV